MSDVDEWIPVSEAAILLDVSVQHVHALIKKGHLVWRPKLNVPQSPKEVLKSSAIILLPDSKKPNS